MKIFLASDHAGFELKHTLTDFLRAEGHEVEDMGPHTLEPMDDYPDYIEPLAEKVAGNKGTFGVAIGGSGEGEAMAANRIQGARAAEYYGGKMEAVTLSREHNDANILALGARLMSVEDARAAVKLFLETPFSGEERHVRRISKLGFTLIELLAVIAVIGVLASVVFVSVSNAREKARDARRLADIKSLVAATEAYVAEANSYPGGTAFWWAQANNRFCGGGPYYALVPGYFVVLPDDPRSSGPPPSCTVAGGFWYYYGNMARYAPESGGIVGAPLGNFVYCSKLESSGTTGYINIPNPWGGTGNLNYCVNGG